MSNLLNAAAVKRHILERAAKIRPHWGCTRVSAEALEGLEAHLRRWIDQAVQGHPSVGKTFKP